MGRSLKPGFEFFPLDCGFFDNDKIKALRRAHGEVGILTYLNLLTRIYRTNGYYYKCTDLDALAEDIAEQLTNDRIRRKTACVRETINYLIGHEILDRGLAERGIISGNAMQVQYVVMAYKAKRKIQMDVHRLVDVDLVIQEIRISSEEMGISSEEKAVNSEKKPQSKERVKYIDKISSLPITHARGKHQNVMLTDEELADLTDRGIPVEYIDHFSDKLHSNKYTYQDHHRAIIEWWEGDRERWRRDSTPPREARGGDPPSSFDTESFFDAALRRSYGEEYHALKKEEKPT